MWSTAHFPPGHRSRSTAAIGLALRLPLAGALIAGCAGDPGGPRGLPPSRALVSAPLARPVLGAGATGGALTYVSMSPGTEASAARVTVVNPRLGDETGTLMSNGGFDPIRITAAVGDTLQVTVVHFDGDSATGYIVVPVHAPPVLVRSSPPNRKTDVPLNSASQVIFTEPMLGATLAAAVHQFLDTTPVVGTVAPIVVAGDTLGVTFTPAALLAPASTYHLEVTTEARSVRGDALEAPVEVTFTTAGLAEAPCVHDCWTLEPVPNDYAFEASQGVGVVNGLIYDVLAMSQDGMPMYAYDPVAKTWAAEPPMPVARWDAAGGVLNGILYIVGGDDNTHTTATTHASTTLAAYDAAAKKWQTRAPMPTARWNLGIGIVNGILYAVGGIDSNFVPLTTVEAYDPQTNRWSSKAPLPVAHSAMGIGVANGVLYAIGGDIGLSSKLGRVDAYDPTTDRWTTVAPMPTGRHYLGVGNLDGLLFAVGGVDDANTPLKTVEAYDPSTNQWATRGPLHSPTFGPVGVAVVNGTLYAAESTMQVYHP